MKHHCALNSKREQGRILPLEPAAPILAPLKFDFFLRNGLRLPSSESWRQESLKLGQ
jgi:hypothetical protein